VATVAKKDAETVVSIARVVVAVCVAPAINAVNLTGFVMTDNYNNTLALPFTLGQAPPSRLNLLGEVLSKSTP
jgi:hypothetical protein